MSAPYCYLFDPQYAAIQQIKGYQLFRNDFGSLPVSVQPETSISLPYSPFGGLLINNVSKPDLFLWLDQIMSQLRTQTKKVLLKQPITIYPTPNCQWLLEYGFLEEVKEIGHYVNLQAFHPGMLHAMQLRKLKASSFKLQLLDARELPTLHRFIQQCRAHQGLEINITLERLSEQVAAFPDRFLLYAATAGSDLASACIITLPTDQIAYYYLPATNPAFKSASPMVPLMVYMYQQLQTLGYRYLDLGISSIEGTPQSSLITFKERMGGLLAERTNYGLSLSTPFN